MRINISSVDAFIVETHCRLSCTLYYYYTSMKLPYFIMECNRSIIIVYCTLVYCMIVTYISSIGRFATSISLREHANERYAECLGMNWCSKHLIIINNPTQNDLFTEIDNFIEVYNNSVIELVQCFGTSFLGRIDHLNQSINQSVCECPGRRVAHVIVWRSVTCCLVVFVFILQFLLFRLLAWLDTLFLIFHLLIRLF